uniref:Uncharacterized protein n=1 Tax=Rhizophora mucronata TaxID=61149 RepID=A0A2P2NDH9_RHIMU
MSESFQVACWVHPSHLCCSRSVLIKL